MKIPLSWLKEYVALSLSPQELADVLTLAGLEVDGIDAEGVLDVALTPNLGHCMSILGVARELAALLNIPLKKHPATLEEGEIPTASQIQVSLIDKTQALRFGCRVVMGVKVASSPGWMRDKLEACGIRSINNVVDVGNLVMLELGQPLHLFDYDAIEGKHLIVTSQTPYSELETLDDVVRLIPPEAVLICDEKKPLSFAGIMGGKSAAVTERTQNVLIEAACFTPQAIRKAAKLLGLRSASSYRFEKGIDPNGILPALDRAASLLSQVAGGVVSRGSVDHKIHEFKRKKIQCRIPRVNQILGTQLSLGEVAEFMRRLDIEVESEGAHLLTVLVPTYRNDLKTEIDLIEEVARIYGYGHIPEVHPKHIASTLFHAPLYLLEKNIRTRLLREGLQEFLTCDLISPSQAEMALENALPKEALISVLHPSSIDQSVLRTSLLPGLLQVVKYNQDRGSTAMAGFEIGRIHFREKENFIEHSHAAIVWTGTSSPYHFDPKPREVDFFDLKGILENLFKSLNISNVEWGPSHLHHFHPGRQAQIKVARAVIGVIGEVHPRDRATLGIDQRMLFAELNLHDLMPLIPKHWLITDLNPYPGSERDWTVTLKQETPIAEILQAIRTSSSYLLEQVYLLDLYKSEQIGKDRKNATFRFFYRSPHHTIACEAVDEEHARLTQAVAENLKKMV